jgi:hypothetical protein
MAEVTSLGTANPAATYTVQKFMDSLTTYKDDECKITFVDKPTCTLSNLDIDGCTSTTVRCCNDSAVSVLTCTSSFINQAASSTLVSVYSSLTSSDQAALSQRLANYLATNPDVPPSDKAANTSSLSKQVATYMKSVCNAKSVTEQNASMPSLKLKGCHNDLLNVYNRSDVNIRCAAGALSHLLPPMAAAAPPPAVNPFILSPRTKLYLVILVGVFFAFMILLILCGNSHTKDRSGGSGRN